MVKITKQQATQFEMWQSLLATVLETIQECIQKKGVDNERNKEICKGCLEAQGKIELLQIGEKEVTYNGCLITDERKFGYFLNQYWRDIVCEIPEYKEFDALKKCEDALKAEIFDITI